MTTVGAEGESALRRAAQQEVAVEVLGEGRSYQHAAQSAGVDRRTVTRWMADPSFARRVSERRGEWINQITGELVAAGPDAVLAIRRELVDAERPADRLRAAALLLTLAHRFREQHELSDRLRELEARLGLIDANDEPGVEGHDEGAA
jgi:hypothetical protein